MHTYLSFELHWTWPFGPQVYPELTGMEANHNGVQLPLFDKAYVQVIFPGEMY